MLGVCRQYVKDLHHAEDLLLQGFLKVFTNLNTFKHEGSFEGWIRRIMVNTCISYLRKKNLVDLSDKDYVFNDTLIERRERRLESFDTIFTSFRKPIDSLGIENIDAKPIRFFKDHDIYEPFKEEFAMKTIGGEKMYTKDANVFAYYKKEEPEEPLRALLFHPETNKLIVWIMMNQGGYKYFLTFNLF